MKKALSVIMALVLVVVAVVSMTGCQGKGDWDYIQKKGELIVGYDNAFPPMGFVDTATGKDVGFDLDLAQAVGDYLNVKVKFQPIDWTTKEVELKAKNIDLIWNGYTITEKRQASVNFSVPYLKNEQVVVIRIEDKAKYSSKSTLKGVSTLAQDGSTAVDVIAADEVFKDNKLTLLADNVQILNEISMKIADCAVMDYVVANYILSQDNNLSKSLMVMKDVSLDYEEYGIGIRKGADDTTSKINEALKALKENGKLKEIADKWGLSDLLKV